MNRDLGASVLTRVELPHQPAFACLAAGPRIVWLSAPDLHIAEPLCVGEATSTLVTVHNFRDAQVRLPVRLPCVGFVVPPLPLRARDPIPIA